MINLITLESAWIWISILIAFDSEGYRKNPLIAGDSLASSRLLLV